MLIDNSLSVARANEEESAKNEKIDLVVACTIVCHGERINLHGSGMVEQCANMHSHYGAATLPVGCCRVSLGESVQDTGAR